MRFFSTNRSSPPVTFREAVLAGLAPDGGLYMPETIPVLSSSFFEELSRLSFHEIALTVAQSWMKDSIPPSTLGDIITESFNFEVPLTPIHADGSVLALELFHGPTLAFKDFGARFMARTVVALRADDDLPLTIIVATSGDTGGAVAAGFHKVPGTQVVVLYPSGQISPLQERQFTTLGHNITALEVSGNFDDCQRIVKELLLDQDLRKKRAIAPANSISLARLLPQSFYHLWARAQLPRGRQAIFSVPSGNFGNLVAGLLAVQMGMQGVRYNAATNVNAIVPTYLSSGRFEPLPSKHTLSTAMDVGHPSNFARILSLYGDDHAAVTSALSATVTNDDETGFTIRDVYERHSYLLDPHSAVGYHGLLQCRGANARTTGVVFATAHPCKFPGAVNRFIDATIPQPPQLVAWSSGEKKSVRVSARTHEIREIIAAL